MIKILVTGPESSGKSTLARGLATFFSGAYVPEFARGYLEKDPAYVAADLDVMLAGQLAGERAALDLGDVEIMICDTGPIVLYVWSSVKYGQVSKAIAKAIAEIDYDLILLCYPDLPWADDPLREHPDVRDRLLIYERYLKLVHQSGITLAIISGEDREQTAIQAIRVLYPNCSK
ncbi:AAA family ATPase [Neolewinella antarctica]|uniref:NadR type nicotinamide-nucleotide adenylyltransferase n=1 Tax=Neolewinella antarctica TaxID=442734 RepID=A0ABX0X6W4_9BACT|nr:ATP-binding protein [Neolewinella antarctica]NJC24941.1 NadR type nicotinamide-nucleotide adenylyltransferase [Neolewinella antarctica]